jgi:hypothetical protein
MKELHESLERLMKKYDLPASAHRASGSLFPWLEWWRRGIILRSRYIEI